jgi:hypothetical protein
MSVNAAQSRLIEEKMYEQVAEELASGNIRQGLWAKALATEAGDEDKTRSCYIKLRVQSLVDENIVNSAHKKEAKIHNVFRKLGRFIIKAILIIFGLSFLYKIFLLSI